MAKGVKTGGRKKGTPNKIGLSVRQAVVETFERLGGVEHMTTWAVEFPSDFYRILARVAPQGAAPSFMNPAHTLAEQGRAVVGALSTGELQPHEASAILHGLAAQARIVEITDMEERLAALEAAQTGT